jgi:3-(3-hydroxy-phenyl)propionate hydroxylase
MERTPVLVVGGGPVGLAAAIDLRLRGVPVVVVEEDETVGAGSRAICWSKRTLEIFDRLGVAAPVVAKGITWNRGKVFFRDRMVYAFDLLPEGGHKFPAFVNLQQYYVERFLAERAGEVGVDLRWRQRAVAIEPGASEVCVTIESPTSRYDLVCDWLVAADGVRSTVRRLLGLDFRGQVFHDRFLITDVKMKAELPTERWFWFDPPFHRGQSALLHRQADDVWRIDLQLGADADPEEERRPERVVPRIRAMLGDGVDFELEWVSVYTFQCRRLERFRHGRVLFGGDAAHTMSPFGARGGNGGIQDADNLAWKIAAVAAGSAPEKLLESYDVERVPAADENILHSTRATDFITPKSAASLALRNATLALAERHVFARRWVNSGRLSTPFAAADSPLVTADEDRFEGPLRPGAPCADAMLGDRADDGWLLERLGGDFVGLWFAEGGEQLPQAIAKIVRVLSIPEPGRELAERYDARPGTFYLIRPDQHVAARWRAVDEGRVRAALDRSLAKEA